MLLVEADVLVRSCIEGAGQSGFIGPCVSGVEETACESPAAMTAQHTDGIEIRVLVDSDLPEVADHRREQVDTLRGMLREVHGWPAPGDGAGRGGRGVIESGPPQPDGNAHDRIPPGVDPAFVERSLDGCPAEHAVDREALMGIGYQVLPGSAASSRASRDPECFASLRRCGRGGGRRAFMRCSLCQAACARSSWRVAVAWRSSSSRIRRKTRWVGIKPRSQAVGREGRVTLSASLPVPLWGGRATGYHASAAAMRTLPPVQHRQR